MDDVVQGLREQVEELRSIGRGLDDDAWRAPSACAGWSRADVVLHLAQTNEAATASVHGRLDGDFWAGVRAGGDVDEAAQRAVEAESGSGAGGSGPGGTGVAPAEVFDRWSRGADEMLAAFGACEPDRRVQWVVGEMAARTLASTRIAEGWIHTGDVAAGLDVERAPAARLWHVVRLVHRTIPYAFDRAGRAAPGPVRFAVTSPVTADDGWDFGPGDAPTVVTGPAVDLCLVAGQRAVASDTALRGEGPDAAAVLELMRTFA